MSKLQRPTSLVEFAGLFVASLAEMKKESHK